MNESQVLVPALGALPSVRLPVQPQGGRFLPYLLCYCVMYGCHLSETCSFLMRDRKKVDLEGKRGGGEGLGGMKGGEIVIKIYCTRKEPIFQ